MTADHPQTADIRRERALVLFSGGQDSTTCLAWALDAFRRGRDHRLRLRPAPSHRARLPGAASRPAAPRVPATGAIGSATTTWSISACSAQISDTALTRDSAIAFAEGGLPNTFVPGRNLMFFTLAAAIGYRRGARHLVGGMCETDYSGYPDCRDDTLKALQATLSLGMDHRFVIHTPADVARQGQRPGRSRAISAATPLVALIRDETHSCYLGDRTRRHDWGYGCGQCPACALRRAGWEAFAAAPTP